MDVFNKDPVIHPTSNNRVGFSKKNGYINKGAKNLNFHYSLNIQCDFIKFCRLLNVGCSISQPTNTIGYFCFKLSIFDFQQNNRGIRFF